MTVYLDTQIVVWLCQNRIDRLAPAAVGAMENADLLISPMVLLELEYLYEIKRLLLPPLALLNQLETQIALKQCDHGFPATIHTALFETWTRDPFDRVIVAQARSNGYAPLISCDAKIRENYSKTIW
ncbi:MAG: PIN domain-containing protein [Bryobacterales bacterium]|nr:PIN domain-containing protein [Bryobacterales bacterium]